MSGASSPPRVSKWYLRSNERTLVGLFGEQSRRQRLKPGLGDGRPSRSIELGVHRAHPFLPLHGFGGGYRVGGRGRGGGEAHPGQGESKLHSDNTAPEQFQASLHPRKNTSSFWPAIPTPRSHQNNLTPQHTGFPAGYGFVEFQTHEVAERVLETCNGVAIRTYS